MEPLVSILIPAFNAQATIADTLASAVRQTWPSISVTVVLPFVPVTATKVFSMSRHASSSSPRIGTPRSVAASTTGAWRGTPGLLTRQRARSSSAIPSVSR